MRSCWICVLGVALFACANDNADTRTFTLSYMDPSQALVLVEPYVPDAATNIRGSDVPPAITITAPEARLDQIADVLSRYDQPTPDVRLRFQVIEADGFTDTDPAIADVQQALQRLFRFRGYRLGADAVVQVRAPSYIRQQLVIGGQSYQIVGNLDRVVKSESAAAADLSVRLSHEGDDLLSTAVTIPDGQTVVVGSSSSRTADRTLILVVRAEIGR